MRIKEFFGIPIPCTEKAVGLKKVTRNWMGKVRTFYEPVKKNYPSKLEKTEKK